MVLHVIGASGRSGVALCQSLAADGAAFTPVVRNAAKWQATGLPGLPAVADLWDHGALAQSLGAATIVVSCAHARHAEAILAAAPTGARFVFLGSTRKFTRWPDSHGLGVLAGEAAFHRSGRSGVMLHPTMIYGSQGEDNVQRLARLLRRLPIVPLPGGGQSLVRPIHQDDVTRAIRAAIAGPWEGPESLVVAGADPVRYADFIRAIARAAGLPPPRIVAVPGGLLRRVAPLTRLTPGVPTIRGAEVQRLLEDKSFDIAAMQQRLGVTPMGLAVGLALTFGQRPAVP
jgi:nucleoside-diphosphate-sugar epimerase